MNRVARRPASSNPLRLAVENLTMSSTFVAVAYDDIYTAQEVRLRLLRMQKEYLIDLEDAVVAVRDEKGKVKLH